MDHTVLPANYAMPLPFLRKRSPDGATPNWGSRHPMQLTIHFSTSKGWKAELAWLFYL